MSINEINEQAKQSLKKYFKDSQDIQHDDDTKKQLTIEEMYQSVDDEIKKITVTLLAKKMNVSKATMSRMINTFYEQGLTLDKGKCQLSKKGQEYIENSTRSPS